MFCKHKWKILSDTTPPSRIEYYGRMFGKCPPPTNVYDFMEMTKRKRILLVTCTECGKIRQFITEI